jgi:hypothetical protein
MRERREEGSGHEHGSSAGSSGRAPGRRTLTGRLMARRLQRRAAPVDAAPGDGGAPLAPAGSKVAQAAGGGATDAASAARLAMTGTRIPLPHKETVEARVGADLGGVQAYSGEPAQQACAMVGAEAFTIGNAIAFADPSPPLDLVLHEVTHVVQQGGDRMSGPPSIPDDLAMSEEGDAHEQEAAAAERTDKPGLSAEALGLPAVQRKPAATDFCKTTKAVDLLDKPGGTKITTIPKGDYVRVDSVSKKSYQVTIVQTGSPDAGKTGWIKSGTIKELHGVVEGAWVFNKGQLGGTLRDDAINCLGHASDSNAATTVGQNRLEDMLKGLGFTCVVGDHTKLKSAIKKKKQVMMVYLYMFKSDWRDPADQGISFADLAKKYGWTANSWREKNVFVSAAGVRQPIDYHAIKYEHVTKTWGYVAHLKPKESDGSYAEDTTPGESAEADPDTYFPDEQKLVSIACHK